MKRKLVAYLSVFVFSLFSVGVFAFGSVFPVASLNSAGASCKPSPKHNAANFCDQDLNGSGYRGVVNCYCRNQVPLNSCADMTWVYNAMISRYGSLEAGCAHNPAGTDAHECMDQWECYMTGHPHDPNSPPCADPNRLCG